MWDSYPRDAEGNGKYLQNAMVLAIMNVLWTLLVMQTGIVQTLLNVS